MKFTKIKVATAIAGVLLAGQAFAADVTGAGASFVFPVMTKWSADYARATKKQVNYQSIGSGGGIAQIKAKTVDFGSSDAPLSSSELDKADLLQFPSVIGGVVPVFNLPGVPAGAMKMDGTILADIYLGKIKKWNDPRLKADNGGVNLPDLPIRIVHRSDGSGTTYNFVNYLSKVSPEWKSKVGEGTSVNWPAGIGGKGNEGVAAYVKQIKGSIGYVELSYALTNKMPYSRMKNRAGNYVNPSAATFQAAAASADWANSKDFNLVITNAPGENAWPITATNFILMQKKPKSVQGSKNTLEFFRWVYANGDKAASALHYVPLPAAVVKQIEGYWAKEAAY